MHIGLLGKWLGAGFLIAILSACGGSSGSLTPFSAEPTGPTINALGVDGPLLDAIVELYSLQDYLTNGVGGATSLLAAPRRSDASTGLIDDLQLVVNPGTGPFVLVVTADGSTTDLSTGLAPALGSVVTVITAAEYALTPQPRFYATPLTTLALRQAIQNAASASETDVLAGLAAAQTAVKNMFGFGITSSIDVFTTPAVIDPTTTSIAQQQSVAELRAAIQTLVNVIVAAGGNANDVVDALLADIADGAFDDAANVALFNAVNDTLNYAVPADMLTLLGGEATELGLGVTLDAGVTLPPGFPSVPDSDQDGLANDVDPSPQSTDGDGDQVLDPDDNCPIDANAGQEDLDGDSIGDVCDADIDGDTVDNGVDNCPVDVNTGQEDLDGDLAGDVCDADDDGDTIDDSADNCPVDANTGQEDLDGDSIGDACDTDDDGDTIDDTADNCPVDANTGQEDLDGDSIGDVCDADIDGDTVDNGVDNCPVVANAGQEDLDGDLAGNVCDIDADGDGANGDGMGGPLAGSDDNDLDPTVTIDTDGDGVDNLVDNCVNTVNAGQEDLDTDGAGNACDIDADGDGANGDGMGGPLAGSDDNDLDPNITIDSDGDGVDNLTDNCVNDANPLQEDLDADGDGDACDADIDGDTIPNAVDPNPTNAVASYHTDFFLSALFAATDQSAFGFFAGTESTISVLAGSNPTDTLDDNVLDLGTDGLGVGTLTLAHDSEELVTDLSLGGSCTPATDCTTASTPTVTGSTAPDIFDFNDVASVAYVPGTTGMLLVDEGEFDLYAEEAALGIGVFAVDTNVDYAVGGTASLAFGQSFIGTQRESSALYPVTSGSGCAAALGLSFSDQNDLQIALDTFVAGDPAAAVATIAAEASCVPSGEFKIQDLGVLSPEPTAPLATVAFDNTNYGLVEFSASYTTATTTDLMVVNSRVSHLAVATAGAVTQSAPVDVTSEIGTADGQLGYNTAAGNITLLTANPVGTGELELTRGSVVTGFAANDLELLTFAGYTAAAGGSTDVLDRGYAVKLGSGVAAADLDGLLYDLQGMTVETSNTGAEMSTFKGATISFAESGGTLTATLSGSVPVISAAFDDANGNLPLLADASESLGTLVSAPFSIDGEGRLAPITFTGSGLELEGFYTANGGLLLRLVDTRAEAGGGGGGSVEFYCGSPVGQTFVDPATGLPLASQPTGSFVCGFVQSGGGGVSGFFTDLARTNAGTPQDFAAIDLDAGETFTTFSIKQGVLFGTVQEPPL